MSMKIEVTDNSMQVREAIGQALTAALHEAGGEFAAQAQRNSRVDTGDTKRSFDYRVEGSAVHVGSNAENAIWEEFGTGVHAEKGGRSTPWTYRDRHGRYRTTKGKRGTRALTKAMQSKAETAKAIVERRLKEVGG